MATSENPEIRRLLGTEGDLGTMLGLDAEWAKRAIMANGNYGEIFAATIGEGTPRTSPAVSTRSGPKEDCSTRRRSAEPARGRATRRALCSGPASGRPGRHEGLDMTTVEMPRGSSA